MRYSVTARVQGKNDSIMKKLKDDSIMKYKQLLMVHEPPVDLKQNFKVQESKNIKGCGCMDKGRANFEATFNKNCFYNNEVADVSYQYDNSKSGYAVTSLDFAVKQHVFINVSWGETFKKDIEVMSQKNNSGAHAGSSEKMTGKMNLDLSNIKN